MRYFKSAGPPEWATAEELANANAIFVDWGLGIPLYYEGRYGSMAAFVDSKLPEYETATYQSLKYTHFVVAQYQIALRSQGKDPGKGHPFVPKETHA